MPLMNKHIVAIDDTQSILNFLRISLEALGARFHGAATASGGLAHCETDKPDLIVLDLGLPDKEGFDILPRLKRLDKNGDIPVIILTIRNQAEDRDRAAALGASAYITKPFVMGELIETIHRLLHLNAPSYLTLNDPDEKETKSSRN
jgi:two-component system, OmpR family, KDP operon response regulator KdpE